ncbi:hypothetical protein Hanom_Chr02g00177241 [Helianthus anomalus]
MEPIKSNCFSNHFPPLDLADMKSQPLKLIILTALVSVLGSFAVIVWFLSHPHSPVISGIGFSSTPIKLLLCSIIIPTSVSFILIRLSLGGIFFYNDEDHEEEKFRSSHTYRFIFFSFKHSLSGLFYLCLLQMNPISLWVLFVFLNLDHRDMNVVMGFVFQELSH